MPAQGCLLGPRGAAEGPPFEPTQVLFSTCVEPPLTLTLTLTPTLTLTQVLFNTWVEAPLGVPQHAAASSSTGSGAGSGEATPHAPRCRPRAEWSDAPPTRREGVGSEGVGSVKAKIWLLGDAAGSQRPTLLAAPELGSCASSGGEPGSGRRHTPRGRYLATGHAATALGARAPLHQSRRSLYRWPPR